MCCDPFARWTALQLASTDVSNRLDEAVDLAFWDRAAASYDAGALPNRVPAVLERVLELVPSGASVLELGAGSGAFTVPLAGIASRVTALDHSPSMLRTLQRKLETTPGVGVANIDAILGRLEDAVVETHDVVLAANSLYRVRDLRPVLEKIARNARDRVVIVWSVGRQDAPQQLIRESVHPGRYRPGPDYVHVVDGLVALDIFANVEMIEVDDTQHFDSDQDAARGLLSWEPITAAEIGRATELLPASLERNGSGWIWPRRGRIAIIWWDQPGRIT